MFRKFILLLSFSLIISGATYAQGSPDAKETPSKTAADGTVQRNPIFKPTKDQIMQVQTILKAKNLYTLEASGKYDDETRAGIKSFQKDNGLKQTGTLNRATLEKFRVELTESQKLIPVSQGSFASPDTNSSKSAKSSNTAGSDSGSGKRSPIFRATKDQIKAAQRLLKSKSMYDGDETGQLNDNTRNGLKKFQARSGIKITGTLNALTLDKMGIALTDKQKADAAAAAAAKN